MKWRGGPPYPRLPSSPGSVRHDIVPALWVAWGGRGGATTGQCQRKQLRCVRLLWVVSYVFVHAYAVVRLRCEASPTSSCERL